MRIVALTQTYRSIGRIREIVGILSHHGFNQVLQTMGLGPYLPLTRRFRGRSGIEGDTPVPIQLRMALEDLGPTFIKLGQMLATRPDLVPPEFTDEFKKLRDHVPPFSFEQVRRIVEKEIGATLEEGFAEVDPEPMAAASIAQVHRARLLDGSRVVLKVQRPGIDRTVSHDLATLYLLAGLVERYLPEAKLFEPRTIVDEFARTLRKELDFLLEASNTERFRLNFAGDHEVVIPAVRWEVTSKRLLVLDAIEGDPADDPAALTARGLKPNTLARIAARTYFKQVFDDGLFHGDLHPGNLLVTPDGRLGLLDFGAVGYLSEDARESLGQLFLALIARDYVQMADGLIRMGSVEDSVDLRAFRRDLTEVIEPYHGRPLKDLRIGHLLREAAQIALRHRVRVPPDLLLLARTTLTIEGVACTLDPDFVILDEAIPYARKILVQRLDPRRQARSAYRAARDTREFLSALPSQLTRIFQKLLEGRIAIDFVHKGFEPALDEMDRSSNRISFSLIVSALIVGSSLLVLSGRGPQLWEFPVFGLIGFGLAGVLGFGLAFAILRSGKL